MVEMGTFVAILLGSVAGGLLIALPGIGATNAAAVCIALALAGRFAAQAIPASPSTEPGLAINWNPFSETWRNLRLAHANLVVFRSLLGISWMWFFGAVFLSQFPAFAKDVLHGNEQVASLLLVVFSIGIGTGSLLCETLSKRHVEIGLVPLGAIGMSVFAIDLYFASRGLPATAAIGVGAFLAHAAHWRVLVDLLLLSLCAGLYSVPMYALIQLRSVASHRARIIAANNILNALFMIASSIGVGALLAAGFTLPQVFLATGLLNALVAAYIVGLVPEYLLRFVAFVATRCIYRLKIRGDENIPVAGAAIPVCNHVSFIDAVLLMAASPRPIVFIIGPPHLPPPGARRLVPAGHGDPDRGAPRGPAGLRTGLRARRPGAGRGRPAVHLSRRRADARRPARRVQGRGDEAARKPPGAGDPARAAEPVGIVLLAHRRCCHAPAVSARDVQPGRRGGRAGAGARGPEFDRDARRGGRLLANWTRRAAASGLI